MKVLQLSEGLKLRGFEIKIVCRGEMGEIADRLIEKGFDVIFNPMRPYRPDQLFRFLLFLRRNSIPIVHSYNYGGNFSDALMAKLAGSHFISSRENMRHWDLHQRMHFGERIRNRLTDDIIAISIPVRDLTVSSEGVQMDKITVITNGIPLEEAKVALMTSDPEKVKMEHGIPTGETIFGTLSNLRKVKGNDVIIKAFAILRKRTTANVHLCIFGHGSEKESLEGIISENGLADSVTLKFIDINRFELINIIDVFILGSLQEGYSLSIMEAMTMGKPVIATNVGGNPYQIEDQVTGLLVPSNDPEVMADAMIHLLQDEETRTAMGRESRRKALRDFSAGRMIDMHESMYTKIILNRETGR